MLILSTNGPSNLLMWASFGHKLGHRVWESTLSWIRYWSRCPICVLRRCHGTWPIVPLSLASHEGSVLIVLTWGSPRILVVDPHLPMGPVFLQTWVWRSRRRCVSQFCWALTGRRMSQGWGTIVCLFSHLAPRRYGSELAWLRLGIVWSGWVGGLSSVVDCLLVLES